MKTTITLFLLILLGCIGLSQGTSTEDESRSQKSNQGLGEENRSRNSSNESRAKIYMGTHLSSKAPFAISIGSLGDNYGFYLGFRTGFNDAIYECDESGILGVYDPDSYVYNGDETTTRFSLTIGLTQKMTNWLWWYSAIGYGNERFFHSYDEYSSFYGYSYGETVAEHVDYRVNGLEWEAGLITNFNGFSINLGYSCLNFSSYNITFGLGFAL